MNDGLMRRAPRTATGKSQEIVDEVALAGLAADGALALSGHIMESALKLDEHRRILSRRASPEMQRVLLEFEMNGFEQAEKVQRELFNRWKM